MTPLNPSRPENLQAATEPDLDLSTIICMILRRRRLLVCSVILALLLASAYLAVVKTRYRAEAQLQLLRQDSAASTAPAGDSGLDNALDLNLTMETYVGVLTSDNLALQVIEQLSLEGKPGYLVTAGRSHREELSREQGRPLAETRFRREAVLKQFKSHLNVSVVSGSRLISIGYLSPNPELARQIVSHLVSDFITYNEQVRTKAVDDSNASLTRQLDELRHNAEMSQQHATELQQNAGIYGTDDTRNLALSRLAALNQQTVSEQENLNGKLAILNAIETNGGPEAISNLSSTSGQSSVPESVNALASLQGLRQQKAALSSQLALANSKYGSNNPQVKQIQDEIASQQREIDDETSRLRKRAENDVATARERNTDLQRQLGEQEGAVSRESRNANSYLLANRDAAASRELFEHLLERSKETHVLSGVEDNSVSIIDEAHVSASPASPNRLLILAGALGGGLVLGLLAVFLQEGLDRSVRDGGAMQRLAGAPLLGTLPLVRTSDLPFASGANEKRVPQRLLHAATEGPQSRFTESCRLVRTSLGRLAHAHQAKVLMITSPSRLEGKTTVLFNLANLLTQQGARVLVMDADLRRGGLSGSLDAAALPGLTDLVAGPEDLAAFRQAIRRQGSVDFLPAGTATDHPSELLSSVRFKSLVTSLAKSYEYILIDSVPVLPLSDAIGLAGNVDAVVLVGRSAAISDSLFASAVSLIQETSTPILGVICNAVDTASAEYKYLHGRFERAGKRGLA